MKKGIQGAAAALAPFTAPAAYAYSQLLLTPGFDGVNATTGNGWTALHIAARSGYAVVLEILLNDKRVDVHIINKDGQTALGTTQLNYSS